MRIRESCSCGASVSIEDDHVASPGELLKQQNIWRKYHRCVEPVVEAPPYIPPPPVPTSYEIIKHDLRTTYRRLRRRVKREVHRYAKRLRQDS